MTIEMHDYQEVSDQDQAVYNLRLKYRAMNFFELINNFQFSTFSYILLFTLVALILLLAIIIIWAFNVLIARVKKPQMLMFKHMARCTIAPPTIGSVLASIPVLCSAGILQVFQGLTLFDNIAPKWQDMGSELSSTEIIDSKRGRLGLQFVIIGFVCLFYGAAAMVPRPTQAQEHDILEKLNKEEKLMQELSIMGSQSTFMQKGKEIEAEEKTKIRSALSWKRKTLILTCMVVALGLLLKLEFSYTKIFSENIYTFLVCFMILDILLEQLLNRAIMAETLLVSPIIGSLAVTEFIMTMGADDFQNFVISYFIETALVVAGRVYIGPAIEKKMSWLFRILIIQIAPKCKCWERIFAPMLRKQLIQHQQLQNLSELHHFNRDRHKDTGEGLKALLGSVADYACHVQALFLTPVVLVFVIFFAQETKIPQNYSIRKSDLNYYLMFSIIMIFPQLIVNIFLLHILEVLHGFKIYDYLTFSEYRFKIRTKKWINRLPLDRSVSNAWRSLDNMSFSSQFYFVITLVTWGTVILTIGCTTMIKQKYNPFADPLLLIFVAAIIFFAAILKVILSVLAGYINLWKPSHRADNLKIDTGAYNVLDKDYDLRKNINSIQNIAFNHQGFRHKFIRINRAWIIDNLSKILTREYIMKDDEKFLFNVFQEAVNADAVEERLNKEQAKIKRDLALMPYNNPDQLKIEVSDDSISDIPLYNWKVPEKILTNPNMKKLSLIWLDFARQNMKLKEMVVDIVMDQMK
jgi:hypothetical protein